MWKIRGWGPGLSLLEVLKSWENQAICFSEFIGKKKGQSTVVFTGSLDAVFKT